MRGIIASVCSYGFMFFAVGFDAHAQSVGDPLAAVSGRWQVVDLRTGEITAGISCENPHVFEVSTDRRFVDLDAGGSRTRYIVLHTRENQFLGFIEGEQRVTDSGNPVIWWAVFSGPDRFRWRRYDLASDMLTIGEWRRCV